MTKPPMTSIRPKPLFPFARLINAFLTEESATCVQLALSGPSGNLCSWLISPLCGS